MEFAAANHQSSFQLSQVPHLPTSSVNQIKVPSLADEQFYSFQIQRQSTINQSISVNIENSFKNSLNEPPPKYDDLIVQNHVSGNKENSNDELLVPLEASNGKI